MSKSKSHHDSKPWYADPRRKAEVSAKISAAHKGRTRPPKQEIELGQLVSTRPQTAHMLSCSVSKVIRLEKAGKLTKLRLDPSKASSQVVHRVDQVRNLVWGGSAKVT